MFQTLYLQTRTEITQNYLVDNIQCTFFFSNLTMSFVFAHQLQIIQTTL